MYQQQYAQLVALCATLLVACSAREAAVTPVPTANSGDSVVGVWRIARYAVRSRIDTTTRFPFGVEPRGYLVYDKSGHMMFHVDRPTAIDSLGVEIAHADASAMLDLMNGFSASYGTYVVDVAQRTITHHIEGEVPPRGGRFEVAAPYRVSRDSLWLGNDSSSAWHFARVHD